MITMLLAAAVTLSAATYRTFEGQKLPDPRVTPGVIRTTSKAEICAKTFRTGPFRHTTEPQMKAVCKAYGVVDCPKEGTLEIDHLLPLELGGLDDVKDLWVQPAPAFHWKDDLENKLHAMVCKTGEMSLPTAQVCIINNWVACYKEHVGPLPK